MTAAGKIRELLQLRDDLDGARAALRREQDARADLRHELEREKAQHRADVEGFQSALAQEAHEKSILEQVERDLREQNRKLRADAEAPKPYADASRAVFLHLVRLIQDSADVRYYVGGPLTQMRELLIKAIMASGYAGADPRELLEPARHRAGDRPRVEVLELENARLEQGLELVRAALFVGDERRAATIVEQLQAGEEPHPASWVDCPECKSLSKAGAEPPRCEAFLALEAARG